MVFNRNNTFRKGELQCEMPKNLVNQNLGVVIYESFKNTFDLFNRNSQANEKEIYTRKS